MPASYINYLISLRLRARGNRDAVALIDRCLQLIARAQDEGGLEPDAIDREVKRVADELALRYGAPKSAVLQ